MRKLIVAALLLSVATPAMADNSHRRAHNNEVGIALGVLGLGLGAAVILNDNRDVRECRYRYLTDSYGRQLYDRYGDPVKEVHCH
jgi:hypothetical protein